MKKALSLFLSLLMVVISVSVAFVLPTAAEAVNLWSDGDLESLSTGDNLVGDVTAEAADGSGNYTASPNAGGWIRNASFVNAVVTENEANGGDKSLAVYQIWNTFGRILEVQPNTSYVFTVFYKTAEGNTLSNIRIHNVNSMDGPLLFTQGSVSTTDYPQLSAQTIDSKTVAGAWSRVQISFNSLDAEKIAILIKAGNTTATDTNIYFDDFSLYAIEDLVTGEENRIYNGDMSDVSLPGGDGSNLYLDGITASASGSGASVELTEAADLPSGVKTNTNAVKMNFPVVGGSAQIYNTYTVDLKENTTYEASVWVKTEDVYSLRLFMYEPTYWSEVEQKYKTDWNATDGVNTYSFSYDPYKPDADPPVTATTRVARTDIQYSYTANGEPINGGSGDASMFYSRYATAEDIASGVGIAGVGNKNYYDVTKKFGAATNGWVKLTLAFTTKSGTWSYEGQSPAGVKNVRYDVPVSLCLNTANLTADDFSGYPGEAPETAALTVAKFEIKELNETTVAASTSGGGNVKINDSTFGTDVSLEVDKDESVSFTAEPYAGNTFKGWYDSTETNLVSTDNPYVTTADTAPLKAVFYDNNVFEDPGFESYQDGMILSGVGTADGWTSTQTWGRVEIKSSVVSPQAGGPTGPYSGQKMLALSHRNSSGLSYTFDVEKNQKYTLSLKWLLTLPYDEGAVEKPHIAAISVGSTSLTDARSTEVLATSGEINSNGQWNNLSLNFDSGNNTSLKLMIFYSVQNSTGASAPPSGTDFLYIDDLALTKAIKATATVSSIDSAGSSTAVAGGYASAFTHDYAFAGSGGSTEVTFSATPLYGNTFLGWFKGSELYSTEAMFTESISENTSLEARFISRQFDTVMTNLNADGDFEGYPLGSFAKGGNKVDEVPSFDGTNPNWDLSTGSTWGELTITDLYALSGEKSMRISARHNTAVTKLTGLTPNTDYVFSFYYYFPKKEYSTIKENEQGYNTMSLAAITEPGYKWNGSTGGVGEVGSSINDSTVLAKSEYDENNTAYGRWERVTLSFNTGDNTEVWAHIRYASYSISGSADSTQYVYVDDLSLYSRDDTDKGAAKGVADSVAEIGTAIRTEGTQALRYKSSISKSALGEAAMGDYTIVEYGSVAMKTSYIDEGDELTVGYTNSAGQTAKIGVAYRTSDNTNIVFDETDDAVQFTAALVGITEANYQTDYSVRVYAVLQRADGSTVTVYDDETRSYNIFEVAKAAYESDDNADYMYDNILSVVDPVTYPER